MINLKIIALVTFSVILKDFKEFILNLKIFYLNNLIIVINKDNVVFIALLANRELIK